ncbi:MAG: MmgE/PrpD family protein [Dehalococcoidia bacterium]
MTQTADPVAQDELRKTATKRLAQHAATLTYDMLPASMVDLTKQCVLDTLGVMTGASGLAPEGRVVKEYVEELGGRPESTIFGFGGKAPAPWAVFVNGSLGHMLDYDDTGSAGHPSIETIPVGFAVAEKLGGVSGQQFIASLGSGLDLITRMGLSISTPEWTMSEGWFATQLFGYIAGAATAGRLLGLSEDQMENALGIGFNQLAGSRQMAVGEATDCRSMQAGFCGQGAITAALLAQRGITGPKEIFEGRYGFFKNYIRGGEPDWDALAGELGTRWKFVETHGFKVWPACAATRAPNAAVLHLRNTHSIAPEDVAELAIVGGDGMTELLSTPIESKRIPQVSIDGKYSIPFTAAVMMQYGTVKLSNYTEQGLNDPAALAMAQRVRFEQIPEAEKTSRMPEIRITTRGGQTFAHRVDSVPGDPRNQVAWPQVEAKFRDCVSFAPNPIPAANVERVIEMVHDLEKLDDVTEIVRLMTNQA